MMIAFSAPHRRSSAIVRDGYLLRVKEGRRNRYEINRSADLRHPLFADLQIGPLLDVLGDGWTALLGRLHAGSA
jgi:hypothetical protein